MLDQSIVESSDQILRKVDDLNAANHELSERLTDLKMKLGDTRRESRRPDRPATTLQFDMSTPQTEKPPGISNDIDVAPAQASVDFGVPKITPVSRCPASNNINAAPA